MTQAPEPVGDNPARPVPRCPKHASPLHWSPDLGVFRCKRGNHRVPLDQVAWDEPRRGKGGRTAIGEPVNLRLGEHLATIDALATESGLDRSTVVRLVVGEGLHAVAGRADSAGTDRATVLRVLSGEHTTLGRRRT